MRKIYSKEEKLNKFPLPEDYTKILRIRKEKTGYKYFYDTFHPLSGSSGKVLLHRHEVSKKLCRWITDDEHVHHLDQDKANNSWNNLEILSRNEHTRLHNKERGYNILEKINCKYCQKLFRQRKISQTYCSTTCVKYASRKTTRPAKETLRQLLIKFSRVKVGKMFGVSDNAIKKWQKAYNMI